MSETPDPTRLKHEDEVLRAIMEAFDESSGCDEAPSVRDFCCQWNSRTPCAECANLERRVRQALRNVCADLQAENARLTAENTRLQERIDAIYEEQAGEDL